MQSQPPVATPVSPLPNAEPEATVLQSKSAEAPKSTWWDIAMKIFTIIMNLLVFGFLLYIFAMLISIRKVVGKIWKKIRGSERYIPSHEHYKTSLSPSPSEDEEGYAMDSDDEETPKPKKKKTPDEEGYAAESDDEETPKPKKKKTPDEEGYAAESDDEETPKPKKKKTPDEEGYKADVEADAEADGEEKTLKPKKKTPAPEDFIPVYTNNTIVSEGYYTGGARENFVQQQPRRLFNIFA